MFIYFLEHSGQMVMMIVDLVDEVTVVWLKAAAFCAGKSTIGKNKKNRWDLWMPLPKKNETFLVGDGGIDPQ